MLDAMLALLQTLQQLQCRELHHQLEDVVQGLSEKLLLFAVSDRRGLFAHCKHSVVGSLKHMQLIGDTYTQRLTGAIHTFCNTEMTADWPGNVCKTASIPDTAVLLLAEVVTGKAWLDSALKRRLTSFLQLQFSDTESQLSDLWVYMSEALQVFLCTILCCDTPLQAELPPLRGSCAESTSNDDGLLHMEGLFFVRNLLWDYSTPVKGA